ncbi:MAG: SDR family NAD(P)-dependent oxidoreductase [Pseudomonadota bacterium]
MAEARPLALVAGAGAGLGQSLLARFEAEGMRGVGLGRTRPQETSGLFHQVDLTDEKTTCAHYAELIATYGPPKIVVHNAAELLISPFAETTLADYERCWRSMVFSMVVLSQSVLQPMVRGGGGALIVSGATASIRGGARFSAFTSAKFALRGLTQSLAREYQSAGIHVAHILLDGIIDTPNSRERHSLDPSKMMRPEEIADVYWQIAQQPKSTWTHELDLRPCTESF